MKRGAQLPAALVRFGADFVKRLGALRARRSSGNARSEGLGHLAVGGAGSEFVGYRPYRPGEDLRLFDWSLYSRMRQPFVRVTRREANQSWAVLLDTSASMGIGQPGKLQAAAEVAAALCGLALGAGSRVQLLCSSSGEQLTLQRAHELNSCLAFLQGQVASGTAGLKAIVGEPQRFRSAGSVFLIGDLMDLEPSEALGLARRGRQLHLVQILSPEELWPEPAAAVIWKDPEAESLAGVAMGEDMRGAYEVKLKQHIANWERCCLRHRASYGVWSSAIPFEDVVGEALSS